MFVGIVVEECGRAAKSLLSCRVEKQGGLATRACSFSRKKGYLKRKGQCRVVTQREMRTRHGMDTE